MIASGNWVHTNGRPDSNHTRSLGQISFLRVQMTADRPPWAYTPILSQVIQDPSPHIILLGQLVFVAHDIHPVLRSRQCHVDAFLGLMDVSAWLDAHQGDRTNLQESDGRWTTCGLRFRIASVSDQRQDDDLRFLTLEVVDRAEKDLMISSSLLTKSFNKRTC